ncbi:MAG TPA: hypothetical protein VEA60_08410 [Allosphingosinicella sp.]|nr:hypothetical protein [Allosphingosinicella sp.]
MADGQHKLSRRALLGAPLVPLILSGAEPGRSPVSKDAFLKWDRALARFEAAEAALAAAAGAPDHVYDPVGARHHAALARLLRTPAPDLPALARKLDLALDERTGEFDGDPAVMRILKRDAHRLAAPAA